MILVKAQTTNEAWRITLSNLLNNGTETDNKKYFRDELVSIEILHPSLEAKDPLFPMEQKEIDTINNFIATGEHEQDINHAWTKLYFHRMFDQPNSQVEYMIKFLHDRPLEGEAIVCMWDKYQDQNTEINPCTVFVWGRVKHGKLELHVHAHSSDAYKKLLMNIQEFVAFQLYIGTRIGLPIGRYYHIVDSCHIHNEDVSKAQALAHQFTAVR